MAWQLRVQESPVSGDVLTHGKGTLRAGVPFQWETGDRYCVYRGEGPRISGVVFVFTLTPNRLGPSSCRARATAG